MAEGRKREEDPVITQLCSRVRDFINDPRRQSLLLRNRPDWFQICTALDAVDDSQLGIDAFHSTPRTAVGQGYLQLHGLMQCLFLQQDAITNLAKALDTPEKWQDYPRLVEIREIRNDVTGHPTRRDQDRSRPTPSFHTVLRQSVGTEYLEVISDFADGKTEHRFFSLTEIISDQERYVSQMLANVVASLEQNEAEHREAFKMEKLTELFEGQRTYAIEKIHEAAGETLRPGPSTDLLGLWGVEHLQSICASFKGSLERRGSAIDTYDAAKFHYEAPGLRAR